MPSPRKKKASVQITDEQSRSSSRNRANVDVKDEPVDAHPAKLKKARSSKIKGLLETFICSFMLQVEL